MSDGVAMAVYVYVVLMSLFVFKKIFDYARWVFPRVEGPHAGRGIVKQRALLVGYATAWLYSGIHALCRLLAG